MALLLETKSLLAEIKRVAALETKDRLQDSWCRILLRQQGARRHLENLKGLPSHIAEASYLAMVIRCIHALEESLPPPSPVSAAKAGKVRAVAKKLEDEVTGVPELSSTIAEPGFRAALDRLLKFSPPEKVPVRTRKGNPERRQFIWTVAEAFYSHFECFHMEAITEIVAMRWEETDVRAVRLELTAAHQGEVAQRAKRQTQASGVAATATAAALERAQRKDGGQVKDERPDAQRIQDVLAALAGMADRELGASLIQGFHSVLADFEYQQSGD